MSSKVQIISLKPVLLASRGQRLGLLKLAIKSMIHILIFMENFLCYIMMLYMIFQYVWEPVLIQRISIGFEEILEVDFCEW